MSISKSGGFIIALAALVLLVGPVHGAFVVKDGNSAQSAAGYRVAGGDLNPQPEPPNNHQNQIKAVNPNNAGAPKMPQQPAPPPPKRN